MHGFFHPTGQGWLQLGELTLAFVLSSLVGLEREMRQKSAGLRTYTLVGVSAALFMLISKYGFMDVLDNNRVVVDPSRVAAQIVSGIGFIGGGVIFMRRDVVRGLTTAASVWLTAALGMACGAGLLVLAVATTIGHFVIMFVFPKLIRYSPEGEANGKTAAYWLRGWPRAVAQYSRHLHGVALHDRQCGNRERWICRAHPRGSRRPGRCRGGRDRRVPLGRGHAEHAGQGQAASIGACHSADQHRRGGPCQQCR